MLLEHMISIGGISSTLSALSGVFKDGGVVNDKVCDVVSDVVADCLPYINQIAHFVTDWAAAHPYLTGMLAGAVIGAAGTALIMSPAPIAALLKIVNFVGLEAKARSGRFFLRIAMGRLKRWLASLPKTT